MFAVDGLAYIKYSAIIEVILVCIGLFSLVHI